jgi:hypothetical protein
MLGFTGVPFFVCVWAGSFSEAGLFCQLSLTESLAARFYKLVNIIGCVHGREILFVEKVGRFLF